MRFQKFIPLHPRNPSALIYEVNSVRNFGFNGVNEKVLKRVNGKTSHLSTDVTGFIDGCRKMKQTYINF